MAHDVFISYSNKDKTIADMVCAKLEENKIRVWMAPRDVPPGKDFAETVIDAIDNCRTFVLIWSVESNHSEHVLNEVSRAFNRGITVIPFRIENVEPTKSLEYYIGRTHWLDAINPPLEKHIIKLNEIIKAILGVQKEDSSQVSVMGAEWKERKKQNFSTQDSIEETQKLERVKTGWNSVKIGLLMIGLVIVALLAGYFIRDRSLNEFNTSTPSSETGEFIDEFTGTLDEGWTWLGEDKTHWQIISPNGLRITLEESGWYDGRIWIKPPSILRHERLLYHYQLVPLITRLNKTLQFLILGIVFVLALLFLFI